ncbi:MAG TPA: interleukin-like EMT inducer domain-containing protein, partial [Anaerolineae bacterium]|nr:interleukin-like EMT inducer domain-containing protein [Anaerolineae bacterium]
TRLPGASRSIGTTGVESPVSLVVASAGQEVGNLAEIFIDGRNVSSGGRGYNLAVIDPESGRVEATANFDTHLDEGASAALAAFVAGVPPGHIVAVAAADEASRLLGAGAVEALHGLGAASDLRDRFRWGHALVGVQGAAPGTALEALDWKRPVRVVAGEGATEPYLSAAFGPLTFTSLIAEP